MPQDASPHQLLLMSSKDDGLPPLNTAPTTQLALGAKPPFWSTHSGMPNTYLQSASWQRNEWFIYMDSSSLQKQNGQRDMSALALQVWQDEHSSDWL
jgi:hypothetical protein